MTKRSLPIFISVALALVASLACNRLTNISAPSGFQATANAAFTQAAAGAATAGAGGNSAVATADAASTEAMATANAATGGNPSGKPTATKAAADQPTAAATQAASGGGGPAAGGPKDIPVISGANTILLANDQLVSYQSKSDMAAVVKFYKDEMPKNGWTQDTTLSVETATAVVLAYKKDARQAQVSVTTDPASKQTVVLITIQ